MCVRRVRRLRTCRTILLSFLRSRFPCFELPLSSLSRGTRSRGLRWSHAKSNPTHNPLVPRASTRFLVIASGSASRKKAPASACCCCCSCSLFPFRGAGAHCAADAVALYSLKRVLLCECSCACVWLVCVSGACGAHGAPVFRVPVPSMTRAVDAGQSCSRSRAYGTACLWRSCENVNVFTCRCRHPIAFSCPLVSVSVPLCARTLAIHRMEIGDVDGDGAGRSACAADPALSSAAVDALGPLASLLSTWALFSTSRAPAARALSDQVISCWLSAERRTSWGWRGWGWRRALKCTDCCALGVGVESSRLVECVQLSFHKVHCASATRVREETESHSWVPLPLLSCCTCRAHAFLSSVASLSRRTRA